MIRLTEKELLTPEEIFHIVEEIGNKKDVIIIKNDGIRIENKYSVIIISSKSEKSFRRDSNSISDALKATLKEYLHNE